MAFGTSGGFDPLGVAYKTPATDVTVNKNPEATVVSGKARRKGFAIYDDGCAILCVPYGKSVAYRSGEKRRTLRVRDGQPIVK